MTLKQLSLEEIRGLYDTYLVNDFPQDEVKPFAVIEKAFLEGKYAGYSCPGAYALFIVNGRKYLVDYLAVQKELRGMGIGSRFLRELLKNQLGSAECVLLEIENPRYADDEESRAVCERRERFYLQNGLIDTGVEVNAFGVEFKILEYPGRERHDQTEVRQGYGSLLRSTLPEDIFIKMVKIY